MPRPAERQIGHRRRCPCPASGDPPRSSRGGGAGGLFVLAVLGHFSGQRPWRPYVRPDYPGAGAAALSDADRVPAPAGAASAPDYRGRLTAGRRLDRGRSRSARRAGQRSTSADRRLGDFSDSGSSTDRVPFAAYRALVKSFDRDWIARAYRAEQRSSRTRPSSLSQRVRRDPWSVEWRGRSRVVVAGLRDAPVMDALPRSRSVLETVASDSLDVRQTGPDLLRCLSEYEAVAGGGW